MNNNRNKVMKMLSMAAVVAGLLVALTVSETDAAHHKKPSIVGVASKSDSFKTLVAAIKAADLVDILESKGPFTVFAPTDAAFKKLPEGTLDELLKPENKWKLRSIVTYHVVAGKVTSDKVSSGPVKTINGEKLSVKVSERGVYVDNAKVTKTDIEAGNGVIHVVNSVLLP